MNGQEYECKTIKVENEQDFISLVVKGPLKKLVKRSNDEKVPAPNDFWYYHFDSLQDYYPVRSLTPTPDKVKRGNLSYSLEVDHRLSATPTPQGNFIHFEKCQAEKDVPKEVVEGLLVAQLTYDFTNKLLEVRLSKSFPAHFFDGSPDNCPKFDSRKCYYRESWVDEGSRSSAEAIIKRYVLLFKQKR